MSEPEVIPPPESGWQRWINDFPTMKALAIFCFIAWNITPIEMTAVGWLLGSGWIHGKEAIDAIQGLIDKWLDALNWLTLAAVFGVVGKFATTKPEVIRAEGEAKAAQTVAAAQADAVKKTAEWQAAPQPVGAPHPRTDPAIVAALEGVAEKQRQEEAILAQEADARRQKHALAPPNGMEE